MEIARHWRLKKERYALKGEVCPHCEAKIFPPKAVCPGCGAGGIGGLGSMGGAGKGDHLNLSPLQPSSLESPTVRPHGEG